MRAGETVSVEFKGERHRPLNDRDLVEAVVCLANRSHDARGWLLVGVEDDGTVTGARPRHGAGIDPSRVEALIAALTRPSLGCRAEVLLLDDRPVLAIEVPMSRVPVGTAEGRYVRRALGGDGRPSCVPFHFHEMQSHLAHHGVLDYTSLVVEGAGWGDLDPLEFERFRRNVREAPASQGDRSLLELSDLDLAKALGAVQANHDVRAVTVLGLLLFGREEALRRFVPTHEVAFQVLADNEVRVNAFYRWPLIRVMDEVLAQFRARTEEREVLVGMVRVAVPDYAEPAVREGLTNALVHRDYTRLGAVHFQWYPDRITIASPGGFPAGVTLQNLLVTAPVPRNPLLADAFKRAGIVERTARGIDTIFYHQTRYGRPRPSYEQSSDSQVRLDLFGGPANLDFVKLVVEEAAAGTPIGVSEMLVLNELLFRRRVTTREVALVLQNSEAAARGVLERLVERGLVEGRGSGRAREYHFATRVRRQVAGIAGAVRAARMERAQEEQLVLQYARTYGRITRREAMELCRMTGAEATRLLGRLVRSGVLRRVGERRGAYYVPGSADMNDRS